MSKFRYSAIRSRSAWDRLATYGVEPTRPDSSAPHHAKRSMLRGLTLDSCSAASRMAAEPEPLSLMPGSGDDRVEVRAGHHHIVRVATRRFGDTLSIITFCGGGTSMCAVEPGWARATPSANEAPTTGMVIGPGPAAVPWRCRR